MRLRGRLSTMLTDTQSVPSHRPVETLLTALVESSDDAIFAKDLDGTILTWNQGAERIYGYRAEEAMGRHANLLLPPDRSGDETDILARIRRGERIEHFETIRIRKDGSEIGVSLTVSPVRDTNGKIVGASHVARNITDRTVTEAATAHLAAIVGSSEDAVVSKNLDGVILTWNAGAERLYGYFSEEMRGRPMSLLLPPGRPDEETAILEKLKRGQRVEHFETVRIRKDGRAIDVSLTISPIRDKDGTVRGASHIARDITEQKKLQQQLLHTQKLESIGVLAGGVAHDFNNLLVGILANSSMVASALPASDPLREVIAQVVTAAERAAALTRQLLAYAGRGRFVTEPVNVSALIREIIGLLHNNIPPHVRVRLELKDDLPLFEADVSQLQQVVMNLVINAAEAIDGKPGNVVVSTAVRVLSRESILAVRSCDELAPGQYVVVEVRDDGSGMDATTLQKIFDPFFTTKFTGRGLGLAAVLGIVRGHNGALKVDSEPGRGTTFRIFLPVAPSATAHAKNPSAGAELNGNGTVLIIDDEEIVIKAATLSLRRFGYRTLAAGTAAEGIETFRRSAADIVVVLLDMTMPGMSGEELFGELRKIDPSVRVLLSSGFSESDAERRFKGKRLAGFLQKPYTPRTLAAKVREACKINVVA